MSEKELSLQEPLSEKKAGHDYKDNDGECRFGCGCSVCGDSYESPHWWLDPYGKCYKNRKSQIRLVPPLRMNDEFEEISKA